MDLFLVPDNILSCSFVSANGTPHYTVTTSKKPRFGLKVTRITRPVSDMLTSQGFDEECVAEIEWAGSESWTTIKSPMLRGMSCGIRSRDLLYSKVHFAS